MEDGWHDSMRGGTLVQDRLALRGASGRKGKKWSENPAGRSGVRPPGTAVGQYWAYGSYVPGNSLAEAIRGEHQEHRERAQNGFQEGVAGRTSCGYVDVSHIR